MVGAGYSLNASPLAGVTSRFPTWRQLSMAMFDQLHPPTPKETKAEEDARHEKFNRMSPLRIASEYEAALGREKLNNLIRVQNPDSDFQPGRLHHLLLELPWADVFTTNYDTLLERTDVPGRNYQLVVKAEELPTSFAPRIVKLHGSFPSQTPFIISEEDYRTYPRRFAPFVNTVQQALLENSFVLVGFSGDDPNFLEWTGWIRDELGEHHAPIYLVGQLCLGSADRRLLHNRGVTPIDLAPLFSEASRNQIHRLAIEWFLNFLAAARPPRPDRWPEFAESSETVSVDFPPIVGATEKAPEDIPLVPNLQVALTSEIVVKVVTRWRFERRCYPGWIVLPHQKRKPLWDRTRYWLWPLFHFTKDWPVADRLLIFREINWRLETAMTPLFRDVMEPIENAVNDAFSILSKGDVPPSSGLLSGIPTSVSDVVSAWLELAFGLLREARETFDEQRWKGFKSQIDKVVPKYPEFDDQNQYEEALWAVWNIRRSEAKAQLARWQPSSRSPLACIRKAGLLAELDELGESRTILRITLADVRRALRTHGQNIQLLSLEGWTTYLIFAVELATNWVNRPSVREEFWERWQDLKAWDCSPWDQKDFFEQELASDPPKIDSGEREIIGFDPGRISRSINYAGSIDAFLPAFAFIRFYEQVGIPLRLRHVSLTGETLKNACNWIAPFIGLWSPAILVRAGNSDALANNSLFMTRCGVASMPPNIAQRLHTWCLNIFENELNSIGSGIPYDSAQESIVKSLPEVISRLAFKVQESELRRSFSLALRFHNLPAVRSHLSMHNISAPWFERVFEAAEPPLLLEWLPALIRAPLFDNVQKPDWRDEDSTWPDPMNHFPGWRASNAKDANPDLFSKIAPAVDWLLSRIPSENDAAWRRAMLRLLNLSTNKLLTGDQEKGVGLQAWSRKGANGLPNLTNLVALAYVLRFDAPQGSNAIAAVKQYILSLDPKSATKNTDGKIVSVASYGWRQQFLNESIVASKPQISFHGETLGGIEWKPEEANLLYEKVRVWWEKDKALILTEEQRKGHMLLGGNPVFDEFQNLDDFLRLAVLPWVEWSDTVDWQRLFGWLDELRRLDVYLTPVYPYILLHMPAEAARFNTLVLTDLDSNEEAAVAAAAESIRYWVHLAAQKRIPPVDSKVIDCFVRRIALRRTERIGYCLSVLAHLVFEIPELFDLKQVELLVASLGPWYDSTELSIATDSTVGFPEARRPHLRSLLGGLAGAIKRWYAKVTPKVPVPDQIAKCESACAVNSLPEVRRSFNQWDHLQK